MTHEERFAGYHRKAYLIEQITALASTMTSGQIAAHLRITRNQVMGIVHRNGIRLTSGSQKTKAEPISPIRQHGALSVNFPKKVAKPQQNPPEPKPVVDKKTNNSGLVAPVPLTPNYAVNHPIMYRGIEKSTHSKPLPVENDVAGGAWASVANGCRWVTNDCLPRMGCNLPVCGEGQPYCEEHRRRARSDAKVWVRK